MGLKMRQLVELSGVPKSTILYYINLGLLPKPKKIKANQHIYEDISVDILEFIKMLQKNFNASLQQIQRVFFDSEFDFDKRYEVLLKHLDTLTSPDKPKRYTLKEASEITNTDIEDIQRYIKMEYIYLRDGSLSEKELELILLLKRFLKYNRSEELLQLYLKSAKEIAKEEVGLAKEIHNGKDTLVAMFETLFVLKPYINNMQLLKALEEGGGL